MRRGRRAKPTRRAPPPSVLVAGAVLLTLGILMAGWALLRDGGDDGPSFTPVSRFMDIHGMAVDPERPEVLYVATHTGLIRGVNGTEWARVSGSRDDMMGFTMHPRDARVMWISGHPSTGGNMGVRQTTDAGQTWRDLALPGVDFHTMTVSRADPDRLWGYWYTGQLYRSDDGGRTWTTDVETPAGIRALAAPPDAGDTLYAATSDALWRTTDAAQTWQRMAALDAFAVAVDPADAEVVWAVTRGGLARSGDGGTTWSPLAAQPPVASMGHIAIDPTDSNVLYVGTYTAALAKTTDGGATWTVIKEEEPR